ncbi:MAG: ABC transporter permease [Actinomycetota bacterium]|nr:ABC transporter permease [Actinomycetota bacterium]
MTALWNEVQGAVPLILHGNPTLVGVIWFTLQVSAIATAGAVVIGLPIGLTLGLGRFRGRGALQVLANASLGLPPVLIGLALFLASMPKAPLGFLHLQATRQGVFIAQTILALPYVVAVSAAAVQGLPPALLDQARALGARRRQVYALALREAKVGVMASVIAALGATLAEVGAIVVIGGNIYGYNQTLASAALFEANGAHYQDAVAVGMVLIVLILILMGVVSVLQLWGNGIPLRFRSAT